MPVETRGALLHAALELLQRVGFASFSFRDLASAVGISSASVHYHFPTKTDLGVALVEALSLHLHERELALRAGHPSVPARLIALAEEVAAHSCDQDKSCPVHQLIAEYQVLPPPMQTRVARLLADRLRLLASWLAEGRAAGALRFPGAPEAQARLVLAVLEQGSQFSLAESAAESTDAIAIGGLPALMRQLVAGMGA